MPKKKTKAADKNQPSLYGEVDELYNLLSAHESADKEAVEGARKRVTNAEEHATEMEAQLFNTRKAMKIVERRRDELRPKPVKVEQKKAPAPTGAFAGSLMPKPKKTTKEKVEAVVEKVRKETPGAKGRIEGKRPKPEGKPPKATKAPPKKDEKKK